MCLIQIKQAQIKFPLSGFWTVYTLKYYTVVYTVRLPDFFKSRFFNYNIWSICTLYLHIINT